MVINAEKHQSIIFKSIDISVLVDVIKTNDLITFYKDTIKY